MKKFIVSIATVLTLVASMLPAALTRAAEGPLASVAISPAPALVAINGEQQFTAVSRDGGNQTVSNVTYNWSVVAGGGTINATSGLFTAGNDTGTFNGTVQVTAVQGNVTLTAVATVTVTVPGQIVSVEVSPEDATLPVNGTQQFTAVATDAFDQNATGVNITWSVVAGGGSINSTSGLFTAGNTSGTFNGTVQATAVQGNITLTAVAAVTVEVPGRLVDVEIAPEEVTLPVNGTQQFTAVATDAFEQNATGVNVTWSVIAGGGTINATSGLFTAGNTSGTFNDTVQVTAVQGNITLTAVAAVTLVTQGTLDHVVISPANATIAANGTQQFTAVAKDTFNNNVSNVTYNWSVVAGGGTINATSGLFTAGNASGTFNGTVQVTAVHGNITLTAVATVTVGVSGQLVSVEISPEAVTLPVNGTQQFTAVATDAFDQNATGVNITWSVVAGGGSINSTSGLFTAGNTTGNGTVQVTAVQGNITLTAVAAVTLVTQGTLDHVVISPANTKVTVNGTRQFTAVAKDVFNNNVSNVTYNWSVVAGGGTINSTSGLFTAGNTTGTFNGTVQVTAVQGDITRTANATVTVAAPKADGKLPPGFEKGKKKGWDDKDTPPGWEHGKKKGWDGKDTPPGLARGEGDEDDDNEGQIGAEHGNPGKAKAKGATNNEHGNPGKDNGQDAGDADHSNAGNNPAAGNTDKQGKKGED